MGLGCGVGGERVGRLGERESLFGGVGDDNGLASAARNWSAA